jgi:hypothetical protein
LEQAWYWWMTTVDHWASQSDVKNLSDPRYTDTGANKATRKYLRRYPIWFVYHFRDVTDI